jgi:hypothetical protein
MTGSERRSHRRLRLAIALTVRLKPLDALPIQTRTVDISGSGIFFESPVKWDVGSELDCQLMLPALEPGGEAGLLCCTVQVVRVVDAETAGRFGTGVAITKYSLRPVAPPAAAGSA